MDDLRGLLWLAGAGSLALLSLLRHRRRRLPPGPRPLPVIGNLLDISPDEPHRALARLAGLHGPLISFRLGAVTTVVASSPDTAREILQKHDAVLSARYIPDVARAVNHVTNSIAWLPPGQQWRALRKICSSHLFSPQRLDAHRALRRRKVEDMLAYLRRQSEAREPVDVGRVALATTFNLLSRTIFSVDVFDLDPSSSQPLKEIMLEIMELAIKPNISDIFPILAAADLQGVRRRATALSAKFNGLFEDQFERRLRARAAGDPPMNDFLDVLLDLSAADDGLRLDRDAAIALLGDLFVAGSDTSSNVVEWAMTELLRNRGAMATAQRELAGAIDPAQPLEETDIDGLPFLQCVVKETLRLHPPVPLLIPRAATEAVDASGYTIPRGSRVMVNAWAIGRDPAVWPEPEKFQPERFLGVGAADFRGRDMELLPFGAGRRICPGMPLGVRMVHLMLGSLLREFEWRADGELAAEVMDAGEKFGLTVTKKIPLRALAVPIRGATHSN